MAKAVAKRRLKKSYYEKIDKTSNKKEFKILNILNKPTQIKDIHMDTFDTEQINLFDYHIRYDDIEKYYEKITDYLPKDIIVI